MELNKEYLLKFYGMFNFFNFLSTLDAFFWGYIAFILIVVLGILLTAQSGFFQIRNLPQIVKTFFYFLGRNTKGDRGVHPLRAFFASTGGMIGIGNVVGIVTAIQIGGPGALLWVWIAGIIGGIVKYCEIFLGFKYRTVNEQGGYDGGPMYFLKKAFGSRVIPLIVAALLCVYGVEIYQFSVITESISTNWQVDKWIVIVGLLAFVLYASLGGVRRIGTICSWVMPFFLFIYACMGLWVIVHEIPQIPSIFANVFVSAFTGHAAVGGFAGSSVALAIQHGVSRASYSADIGIGYDSIIQSESSATNPARQARLAILGVLIDNIICTFSILIVLTSGVWKALNPIEGSQLIQVALSSYFPFMEFFIPFFFIVTGYTTIIAYFVVGIKCASFLAPKWGRFVYLFYGTLSFIFFSFVPQNQALLVMSVSGSMLLMINLLGVFLLRKEISFADEVLSTDFT